ncbi:hypothetical protein CLAFUW4_01954 [Fulvia fulva]|uniref:Uncharacterized protein n=1 Tax=Passalora fulva TaxID=5499 RepID=A0A9Q8L953_PASFU|nr:uncharacterized protein CLAFUR5_01948 [Fulvia fulva]KAK4635421.1 hypothetical protein CLAFUR4_01949 [Fulvia fulva]KAK4638695.1 hypothetical protein CLAFUR0_01951 [Fulvia fulva]UJO12488.1 hypothetical protein CLAFUR5_01948 [Fulvia fulva]WPV09592.1 hypothetical protein CLAFUW4_01954 [Fulvia fulva]WPV23641.1 hypothetical protein CLAFUW7_01953 [Fulvia fulva]
MPQGYADTRVEAGPSAPCRRKQVEQSDETVDFSQDIPSSPPVPVYTNVLNPSCGKNTAVDGDINMGNGEDNTDETIYHDAHSQSMEDPGGT